MTRTRTPVLVAFVLAVLVGALGWGALAGSSTAPPDYGPLAREALHVEQRPAAPPVGAVPDGTTVFADHPTVTHLDPALLAALRSAADAAARDGVRFYVNSGWRSAAYQQRLLDQAVSTYGSRQEAARWVATPETSPHVSGDAVDLAADAARWLPTHGAAYGLCQIYRNEPWHYELRPAAVTSGCPRMYADPTADPRMQP